MRWILLLAVLAQNPTITGQWVGPLQLTVQAPERVRGAIPTVMDLTQTGTTITGSWRSLPPNTQSGTITGTPDKLRIVFYADSDDEPERCQAEAQATAKLTAANVYRIEAKRLIPDTRARKDCGPWPTDLVWLLQRH
jgi:hypothetical protein